MYEGGYTMREVQKIRIALIGLVREIYAGKRVRVIETTLKPTEHGISLRIYFSVNGSKVQFHSTLL